METGGFFLPWVYYRSESHWLIIKLLHIHVVSAAPVHTQLKSVRGRKTDSSPLCCLRHSHSLCALRLAALRGMSTADKKEKKTDIIKTLLPSLLVFPLIVYPHRGGGGGGWCWSDLIYCWSGFRVVWLTHCRKKRLFVSHQRFSLNWGFVTCCLDVFPRWTFLIFSLHFAALSDIKWSRVWFHSLSDGRIEGILI